MALRRQPRQRPFIDPGPTFHCRPCFLAELFLRLNSVPSPTEFAEICFIVYTQLKIHGIIAGKRAREESRLQVQMDIDQVVYIAAEQRGDNTPQ